MSSWTYDDFVSYWRKARDCDDVSKHFGITRRKATATACRLRARGVKLKKMKVGRRQSVSWPKRSKK